jgi:predicted histidine transporter YuiF (NhaC family)
MITSLKKYSTVILLLLVLLLLVVAWFYPSRGLVLGTLLLLLALAMACIAVIRKHRKSYLQGEITYLAYIRSVALELSGILLAMICAAYLGNYIALLATRSIDDKLLRFAAGVFVGLLAGMVIGAAIRNIWGRFLKPLKQQ